MKKTYIFLLIICILHIGLGTCFVLWQSFHQYNIRYIAKHEKVSFLYLTKTDFEALHWIEKGEEFIYQGKRYDIENTKVEAETYTLTIIHDKLEEEIVNTLIEEFEEEENSEKKKLSIKYPFWEFFLPIKKAPSQCLLEKERLLLADKISAYWFYPFLNAPPPQV